MSRRANEGYGQRGLTLADRVGVRLSQRAIQRLLPSRNDLEVLELGSGYRDTQLIALKPEKLASAGLNSRLINVGWLE